MNEKEKQAYLAQYKKDKEKGIPFFPDAIFKDVVVSFVIFLILIALSYFVGAPLEERANPSDTSYTPRPEWYFLFLFQLLKYFPGEWEVVGVVVLPTLGVLFLLLLPFIDSNTKRHFSSRMWVTSATFIGVLAVGVLSVLAIIEIPPPGEATFGDQTAVLYTDNCAGCHGPTINVPTGASLHDIIAQGSHADMPPWSADLTNEEIDALVGFILSPAGSSLFTNYCGDCHEVSEVVSTEPLEMKSILVDGVNHPVHQDQEIPHWDDVMTVIERTSLLNFLIAPDGQRLFVINCSSCHGRGVDFSGTEEELFQTIGEGGLHLEMPGWQGKLPGEQMQTLARYVMEPANYPEGQMLYDENCTDCHYDRIPTSSSFAEAYDVIAIGGTHETMPVWGDALTEEQLEALVVYTLESSRGTSTGLGQGIYSEQCASCHGDFGEGGVNPARPGDIIAPISTAEYLKTRDDVTLRAVIIQGQPNFGMSPFGIENGGPLDARDVDVLVEYIRSWESNPPVDLPPEVEYSAVALSGSEIYQGICAQCHGLDANGGVGISLRTPDFRSTSTSEDLYQSISLGHKATSMIAWGELLSSTQIVDLVEFILSLPESDEDASGAVSFAVMVMPIFESRCQICHEGDKADGAWSASNYEDVINTGDNSPVIIPGDVENSLLAQKLLGTHEEGDIMPPKRVLTADTIQLILDWIAAGAPDN